MVCSFKELSNTRSRRSHGTNKDTGYHLPIRAMSTRKAVGNTRPDNYEMRPSLNERRVFFGQHPGLPTLGGTISKGRLSLSILQTTAKSFLAVAAAAAPEPFRCLIR